MLGVLSSYSDYDWRDPLCSNTYRLWGNKSQGEPYHIYLLAIACLIEARLGNKAFVHGDITSGQCKKAVDLANAYLSEPIDVPDQCDIERHWKRVSALPISESEQLEMFIGTFLGSKNAMFGEFVRTHYTENETHAYWKKRFGRYSFNMIGGSKAISQYLLWGFNLQELCGLVQLVDKEGNAMHEMFIKRIMDCKLHWKQKDCQSTFEIDEEDSEPYTIWTLMAQFAFRGAENKKIDRYIPLEDIREMLKAGLGDTIDVDQVIDDYMKQEEKLQSIGSVTADTSEEEYLALCEQDAHSALQQLLDMDEKRMEKAREGYDITEYEHFPYYQKGDKIKPNLETAIIKSYEFYSSRCQMEIYQELMNQTAEEKCKWLVKYNHDIRIRDKDWTKIFDDIVNNRDSFSRYFPMVMVAAEERELHEMVRAIVLNDDLYAYCEDKVNNQ